MRPLKLAVVGAGHLGRIHAKIAAAADAIQLAAVVDPVEAARTSVAAECRTQPLADYRDLFGEVDAVVLASPTVTHQKIAADLLRGGLHLLVEKPLTSTLADAQQLVDLAKRQHLVLQVGHVERFNPAYSAVRDSLHDPKYIEARRMSGYSFRSTDIGVVMDLMIHDIDVILNMVKSPVQQIDACGISVLGDHEDMVNARLRFASGCIANLTASRVSYRAERTMQVVTDECFASLDFATGSATLVEPSQQVLQREFHVDCLTDQQKQGLRETLFSEVLVQSEPQSVSVNAIGEEQTDFATAIREGREPQVTGAHGRDAVAVAEGILHRVAQHQWDGQQGTRRGPFAMPIAPVLLGEEQWSIDDTVVMRRKAG